MEAIANKACNKVVPGAVGDIDRPTSPVQPMRTKGVAWPFEKVSGCLREVDILSVSSQGIERVDGSLNAHSPGNLVTTQVDTRLFGRILKKDCRIPPLSARRHVRGILEDALE